MLASLLLPLALVAGAATGGAQPAADDPIARLLLQMEEHITATDRAALLELREPEGYAEGLPEFTIAVTSPRPTRITIRERDRAPLDDGSTRLLLEIFLERDNEGRVATWRADVVPGPEGEHWRIRRMERLTVVTGLYRLGLSGQRQYDVRNLTVRGIDLTLTLPSGTLFVAETPDGPTALVLLGRGRMRFSPPDPAERTQVAIFSRSEVLDTEFDAAFLRIHPAEFDRRIEAAEMRQYTPSPAMVRRATDIFEEFIEKSFRLDLADMSGERWSLTPGYGDMVAEIRTRRLGTLTYARSSSEAEDVSLFDRRTRRNISVYASPEKLESRGRFYNEDDLVDYTVLGYELSVAFQPERLWFDGNARMRIRIRAPSTSTLSLRLAESLVVRGVFADRIGRLLHLRVVGQNSLIVSLPSAATAGDELSLTILYGGRLAPQGLEREVVFGESLQEPLTLPLEPRYLYSSRSYWYPQSTITDYATAALRITVPAEYGVVATGNPVGEPAPPAGAVEPGQRPRLTYLFATDRPVRYLGMVVSRFVELEPTRAHLSSPAVASSGSAGDGEEDSIVVRVHSHARQAGRARQLGGRTVSAFEFYGSLMGEAPYEGFSLAVTESELPGGHSPPYFALLNQPVPGSPYTWRADPVSFDADSTFFLAHEVAHQWWGHGVGWKNYREQWLSEGFAQYFAALYVGHERGPGMFTNVLRQMRRWAIQSSPQGPVHLGYRLGHIQSDSRIFRALVYNKGAMVLHMLRLLVGDEAFFEGLRQYYRDWRFRKAGTEDFRIAMEAASGRDLARFFENWIFDTRIPRVAFSYRTTDDGGQVILRFEHRDEVMDVPVTATLHYRSGATERVVVAVVDRVVEQAIGLSEPLRAVTVNDDHGTLAEFVR